MWILNAELIKQKTSMDMNNVLCLRKIGRGSRRGLLKCFTWPELLSGYESWTRTKSMENGLEIV